MPQTGFLFSVLPLVEIEDHPAASRVLSTDVDLDFLRGDELGWPPGVPSLPGAPSRVAARRGAHRVTADRFKDWCDCEAV